VLQINETGTNGVKNKLKGEKRCLNGLKRKRKTLDEQYVGSFLIEFEHDCFENFTIK
jgi:hypothetical protein